jgi:hypothetical protein
MAKENQPIQWGWYEISIRSQKSKTFSPECCVLYSIGVSSIDSVTNETNLDEYRGNKYDKKWAYIVMAYQLDDWRWNPSWH